MLVVEAHGITLVSLLIDSLSLGKVLFVMVPRTFAHSLLPRVCLAWIGRCLHISKALLLTIDDDCRYQKERQEIFLGCHNYYSALDKSQKIGHDLLLISSLQYYFHNCFLTKKNQFV